MFNIFFKVLFKIIVSIGNIVFQPINYIVVNNFPTVAILINRFNSFINTYIGNPLAFFGALIPPICKQILLFYLAYLVIRLIIAINIHIVMTIFHIIKNIKIW